MDDRITIGIQVQEGAHAPMYASEGASGADVRAHIPKPLTMDPGAVAVIGTGLFFDIPKGYEIQVRSRSGLAANCGVATLNSPGTIDWDYRGELRIILVNHGSEPFVVEPGMRIAQIVVAPMRQACFVPALELSETERGNRGLGHTGLL